MYLVDTDVVSELRKRDKANRGVARFFSRVAELDQPLYLSAITIGELRRGVEMVRHRGDEAQAALLERWLTQLIAEHEDAILSFDHDVATVWGVLRVPHHENAIDKQIAATALVYDLTIVTRNTRHFESTGARVLDPFDG
jgi:hypothetical protein